ncbi:MAG: host attachment protein [Steroidobacteraceae bacterium]
MANIRIVVADRAKAILYDARNRRALPAEVARVEARAGKLADREVNADRPGRNATTWRAGIRITEQEPRRERTTDAPPEVIRRQLGW